MSAAFKKLDSLLHSELRLAVMSLLMELEEADFVYLREKTGATAGNLSVQLDKLSAADIQAITVKAKELVNSRSNKNKVIRY